jgi:superfamily II DNA/RNA helicase
VALLAKSLEKHGFSVGALHGDMEQSARTAALEQFRKGELPILVASDVAARGLDIPAVSHVFNFDVPHHADDYVHRIGRTGRAGRTGTAVSLVAPSDLKSMAAIEKLIGQTIPRLEGVVATPAPSEAPENAEAAPEGRRRTSNREANFGGGREGERKPRRDREARRGSGNREHSPAGAQPREPRDHAPVAAAEFKAPVAPAPSQTPSIGRAEAPRSSRHHDNEPADHSHLPAFLLRPVRARVS